MTFTAQHVLQQALTISPSERAWLAHCLIISIEQQANENVENDWLEVARQRAEQIDSHQIQPISWNTIVQNIRGNHA